MLFRVFLVALTLMTGAAAVGGEHDRRTAQARLRYEAGMAHFNLEEWDAAVSEWEAGYRLKPLPEFMFNIGQAYRKSNRPEKAITFYRTYLRTAPDAENRADVEGYIVSLMLIVQQRDKPKPIVSETAPPPPNSPPPITARLEPPATRADLVATAPTRKPVYKRGWFWGVMTATVLVAAGAVVTGVILGTADNTRIIPAAKF